VGLMQDFKTRWAVLAHVPWYLALGDGACNNVGCGGFSSEWIVAMIGTSGAMRTVKKSNQAEIPWGLWTYRIDRHRYVQGGSLSDGGNVFEWQKRLLRLDTLELEVQLKAQEPDGHGLTILPFLAGERSPYWNPNAQAAFLGMTFDTTSLDIVRASLEAVAYRFALIYALLKGVDKQPKGIIGSGAGLLQSPAWMQIMSDVFDEPLVKSAVPEASSRGAALLLLESMGVLRQLSDAPAPVGEKYEPQSDTTAVYRAAIQRQQDVYNRLFK
jgi:gluconokinase